MNKIGPCLSVAHSPVGDTYVSIYKGRTPIARSDQLSDKEMSTKHSTGIFIEYQVLYGLWY